MNQQRPLNLFSSVVLTLAVVTTFTLLIQTLMTSFVTAAFPASNIYIAGGGSSLSEGVHKSLSQQFSINHFKNNIELTYNPVGSGTGVTNLLPFTSNPFDYAGSEVIPSNNQYNQVPGLQVIPFIGVNVLVVYNLPELSSSERLILDRKLLVDIFSGRISNWNDPSIAALNPSIASKLPNQPIKRVVRSDSSGTTELFTSALTAFAAASNGATTWYLGTVPLPSAWPNETPINISKQKGSSSLGNYVLLNPYTIGYNTPDAIIEQTSALIINAAGKAVAATEETCKSAMSDFKDAFDSRFTANIVNAPGENSYPIAGYSYLIYKSKSMEECNAAKVLYRYFMFLYSSDAENVIISSTFVPLPSDLQSRIRNEYLSKWICSSSESVVTTDSDLVAPILLAVFGGFIALTSLGIVAYIGINSYVKKRKALGEPISEE
ncbi:hypothetical protein FDP41_010842 [Naegleria fowleri]|uniref:PBP domain-containing protein n=1 Tax=Naegleria fowleri TaxID=5763 RepID=A0A6A5BXP1_NAEFO|nr:uncharacterized protein FDP41_010842 [Naegleria fowleri]KAF0982863.1 hypothetical protein FDP41_010842 [Naegleria fowleri]